MSIDPSVMTQNPFTIITVIAAPAILTNASSILGLNTTNRLTRCLDRIGFLEEKLKNDSDLTSDLYESYYEQMLLSQKQARQFLRSLKSTYMSLGAFVLACFSALVGGTLFLFGFVDGVHITAAISILSGATAVLGLSHASLELFLASRITVKILNTNMKSLENLRRNRLIPS